MLSIPAWTTDLGKPHEANFILTINVTDGMFCMNGTTSVPKSVLRYSVDKVRQESESEV